MTQKMVKDLLLLSRMLRVVILLVTSCSFVNGSNNDNIMYDNNKRNKDGTCRLQAIVPCTTRLDEAVDMLELASLPTLLEAWPNDIGYSHLSAVIMAMEHFNERNPVIVKQLENSKYKKSNCNFTFDMDNSSFLDSGGSFSHMGIKNSLKDFVNNGVPCAIAGPYSELASQDIAKLSTAAEIPMVIAKSFNQKLSNSFDHPMVSQISPGFLPVVQVLYGFLEEYNRTNYYNLLYQSSDIGLFMHEMITRKFIKEDKIFISHDSYAWVQERQLNVTVKSKVTDAMEKIKENGFRTIIIIVDILIDLYFIAEAAEELKMIGNDKYLFIFVGSFELSGLDSAINLMPTNVIDLLRGSAFITPTEPFFFDPDNDPFLKTWRENDEEFVKLVNSKYPIQNRGKVGYYQGADNYFQKFQPQIGSAFMYDTVMSIGLGACSGPTSSLSNIDGDNDECSNSEENSRMCSTNDFSALHLQGIRDVVFTGATGLVMFDTKNDITPGVRSAETASLGVVNMFPPTLDNGTKEEEQKIYELTHYSYGRFSRKNGLVKVNDFIFNNNKTMPRAELRNPTNMNLLSLKIQNIGLLLMAIAISFSFCCAAWTFWFRLHRIVTASQPIFLYLLCLGCCLLAIAIAFISFDEGSGLTDDQLGNNCMASIWFVSFGHLFVYGALFTKLWRINKVLQFRKRKVEAHHVAWPLIMLLVAAILVLLYWTIFDPLKWVRKEIDVDLLEWDRQSLVGIPNESFGMCEGNHAPAIVLLIIAVIPCILTCYMAYQTKDIEDTFAESKWIFVLVLVQIQMLFSAMPTIILLGRTKVSSNARYLGLAIFCYSYSVSALSLVMVPKMRAHYNVVHGKNQKKSLRGSNTRIKGGSSSKGVVHISGLNTNGFPNTNNNTNSATNVNNQIP